MASSVSKVDVWAASMEDRPGGLSEKLTALADAGANLEFVIARRAPEKPGTGVVFVTPLKGAKQTRAAQDAGFSRTGSLHSVRLEGPDKPGMGARITEALAEAGVNLRGLSAAAIGRKSVVHLALDSDQDAKKAIALLRKMK